MQDIEQHDIGFDSEGEAPTLSMRYVTAGDLPPQPDAMTGLPEPPRAPWAPEPGTPDKDRKREHDPALAPDPPTGQGPVLFWYRASRRGAWVNASILGILLVVVGTITTNIDSLTDPISWAIIALAMLIVYRGSLGQRYSAGSDWAASGRRWVKTYKLVKVTARTTPAGLWIDMKDSEGRRLSYKVIDIFATDPRIWNYTYNGILHSVIAGGAETNRQLHLQLKLPYPESARPADDASDENADSTPDAG